MPKYVLISIMYNDQGDLAVRLQMNWLNLRNNRLKFKTSGELPITFEEFCGIYLKFI